MKTLAKPFRSRAGFTLIELLTVIAIIAILSAILVPTVGQMRAMAKRANDVNNLRQIAQASLLYATQNGERLVGKTQTVTATEIADTGGDNIIDVAAVLALGAGLNDYNIWRSQSESTGINPGGLIVTTSGTTTVNYDINEPSEGHLSYDYVVGLTTSSPSTTPLAFTRLGTANIASSRWPTDSVNQGAGGHVAFVGGNVNWYETLQGNLVDGSGASVNSIQDALQGLPGTPEARFGIDARNAGGAGE